MAKVATKSRKPKKKRASNPNRGAKPGERRGGRQKGTPNKITRDLKEMVLGALDDAGGRAYLATQAKKNPVAFLTLLGKCLPKEITGGNGKELFPQKVTLELVRPRG